MIVTKIIHTAVIYGLCAVYSVLVIIHLIYLFFTKSNFWKVKARPVPPKCLQNSEYGEHKYITVNNVKLHYVEKGDPSKPLMIFVHGFPEFWYSWRHQLKEFSQDYWTVAFDMRGYGDSEKPADLKAYQIDNLIDDIKGLAEALGREKFYLVVHDWGAVIAFHYVNQYMHTIEKYVCIGAPPTAVWFQLVFSTWDQFIKSWYVFFFQAPFLPELCLRMFDLKIFNQIGHNREFVTEEDLEAYKYTFAKRHAFTGPLNFYRNATTPRRPALKHDKFAPGLYLLGQGESFISRGTLQQAQKLFKNLEIGIIPNANHFAQEDNPIETNKKIREFLYS